jgi:hypothetical protein
MQPRGGRLLASLRSEEVCCGLPRSALRLGNPLEIGFWALLTQPVLRLPHKVYERRDQRWAQTGVANRLRQRVDPFRWAAWGAECLACSRNMCREWPW